MRIPYNPPLARTSVEELLAAAARRAAEAEPGSEHDWRRDHLGASVIGHRCDRFLWFVFRWVAADALTGRMVRLLDRGHREEDRIIDSLASAGFEITDRQSVVSWGGHFGGHTDGVIRGLLEAPLTPHLLEVKTSNRKNFERLQEKGVRAAKPEHYAQMQVYMRGMALERAFYIVENKDDDDVYGDRIALDREFADRMIARGVRITTATNEAPDRAPYREHPPCCYTSKDGTRWPCRFFEHCHGKAMPERNCRTCVAAKPVADGAWHCMHHDRPIDRIAQRIGCLNHATIPSMVNAQVARISDETGRAVYQFADGERVEA